MEASEDIPLWDCEPWKRHILLFPSPENSRMNRLLWVSQSPLVPLQGRLCVQYKGEGTASANPLPKVPFVKNHALWLFVFLSTEQGKTCSK